MFVKRKPEDGDQSVAFENEIEYIIHEGIFFYFFFRGDFVLFLFFFFSPFVCIYATNPVVFRLDKLVSDPR